MKTRKARLVRARARAYVTRRINGNLRADVTIARNARGKLLLLCNDKCVILDFCLVATLKLALAILRSWISSRRNNETRIRSWSQTDYYHPLSGINLCSRASLLCLFFLSASSAKLVGVALVVYEIIDTYALSYEIFTARSSEYENFDKSFARVKERERHASLNNLIDFFANFKNFV